MNDGPQPHAGTGFMNGHPIMPFNDPAASNGYSDYTHNTGVAPMLPSTNMATSMPIQPIPGQPFQQQYTAYPTQMASSSYPHPYAQPTWSPQGYPQHQPNPILPYAHQAPPHPQQFQPVYSQPNMQPLPQLIPPPDPYSLGPQGDPFAATSAQVATQALADKHVPRKRNYRVGVECFKCKNPETQNRQGNPESLRPCEECGRAVHPTCMELDGDPALIYLYQWTCEYCKRCSACGESEEDGMLLCDNCDRGWHGTCIDPPVTDVPEGKWHCPVCPPRDPIPPPLPPPGMHLNMPIPPHPYDPTLEMDIVPETPQDGMGEMGDEDADGDVDADGDIDVDADGDTVTMPSSPPFHTTARKGPVVVSDSDEDEDDRDGNGDIDVGSSALATSRASKSKSRFGKASGSGKPRKRAAAIGSSSATPARPPKRKVGNGMGPPTTPKPGSNSRSTAAQHSPVLPRIKLTLRKPKTKEEEEEERRGLFDDILSVEDRDVSKTMIGIADKSLHEKAKGLADIRMHASKPEIDEMDTSIAGPSSRPLRSQVHHAHASHLAIVVPPSPGPALFGSPAPSTPGGMSSTRGKGKMKVDWEEPEDKEDAKKPLRIRMIRFGPYDIQTWYDAPFPEDYNNLPDGRMFICEYCLKYTKSAMVDSRHRIKCKVRHPPGTEIYRDGPVSVWEVDGRKNKIYCQNLCLLSKMFLDHKSLLYDVEPFLFYVMTEADDDGAHFIGYYSKEKRSPNNYNVSCIMTLPVRQRRGWGNLLIDFSYALSKKEGRAGSPEKPLSDLGALGYRNYWTLALMRYFASGLAPEHPRLEDISSATSMTPEDIFNTLQHLQFLQVIETTPPPVRLLPGQSMKFAKGRKSTGLSRRSSSVRHARSETTPSVGRPSPAPMSNPTEDPHKPKPFVPPERYVINCPLDHAQEYMDRWEAKNYVRFRPDKLRWQPFIVDTNQAVTNVLKTDGPESLPAVDATHKNFATAEDMQDGEVGVDANMGAALGALGALGKVTGGKVPRGPSHVPQPAPTSPQTPIDQSAFFDDAVSVRSAESYRPEDADDHDDEATEEEEKDAVVVAPTRSARSRSISKSGSASTSNGKRSAPARSRQAGKERREQDRAAERERDRERLLTSGRTTRSSATPAMGSRDAKNDSATPSRPARPQLVMTTIRRSSRRITDSPLSTVPPLTVAALQTSPEALRMTALNADERESLGSLLALKVSSPIKKDFGFLPPAPAPPPHMISNVNGLPTNGMALSSTHKLPSSPLATRRHELSLPVPMVTHDDARAMDVDMLGDADAEGEDEELGDEDAEGEDDVDA